MRIRHKMQVLCLVLFTNLFHGVLSQAIDCANPADIMFLIDGSDSIDDPEWDQARNFVARMIQALDISPATINVGMTVYSSSIATHISVYPFKFKIVLTGLARSLQHPTGIATNTALGISKIRETFRQQPFNRRAAPKIMIVITDGSSENPAETINQAQEAKAEGIRIIAVGVGNNVFVEELQQIASNQRKYYQAADYTALQGIESDIRNMICRVITTTQAPSFTFAPPTPPREIPLTGDRICNVPGDIVFVIDGSDSISDADFIRLKNFVANLIGNFEIGADAIHVGMLVYSTLIGDTVGLFPPKQKLILQALARNLKHPRFGTDTALGIEKAREMIRQQGRPNAPEIIVVITDGRSSNPRNTIIQANLAKATGITTIAIGVGTAIFSEELTQIASGPNYVSEVADFRALENIVNLMRNLICTSITTTTTTTTSIPPTMPPYIEPPAEGLICKVPGDVVFLLDGSDSIGPNDWIRQRNFVANLINNLEVGPQYIHVSVVVYSSQIGQEVELRPFKPKPVLNGLVKNLNQPRFGTDTALGIQRARELLKKQGRANAPKVIIVVTDGKSTYPDSTLLQANMAKADGVTVISVGVGSDVFPDELKNIASSERKAFQVIDFAALKNIIGTLRDLICRLVQTTTVAPVTTTTTPTTTPMITPMPVPLYPCGESYTAADLVFLLDGSKAMTPYNWMMSTHFMSNFLDGLELTNQYMHVGVVISDSVRGDSIGITPFKTRFHLKELMHGLLQPGGTMDTATGIRKVIDIFNRQGRPNAQRVMVVLTDGGSKSMLETSQAAGRLKSLGTDVVTVGIGNNVNVGELRNIASSPNFVLQTGDYNQILGLLPRLQDVVCQILRKPTTPASTPPPIPGLCEGCLIEAGVGFNPYPGDCTKFVQCWTEGNRMQYLIRSCPFGQFWDADAITCRPSFLVLCTADPCREAMLGFTYGMAEYGCRSYWKCIDGFSVGHCCPRGSAYMEGMGCLERPGCDQECPPSGGIAMQDVCDKKAHWDKRYYIEIIYGRGEIVRPCPAGTIFMAEKCTCDYGLSALLPQTHVMCKPAAFFPFDMNLLDQSLNKINVGVTNVQRTDLGTALFGGNSEMNLWRFAGTDWGPTLVIKFKFRFDYSNKFIDYGGLPVDLGVNMDMTMNLISDYQMTDADWRLWNQLNNVRTLQDWQQLLREFGQSRTFYIFLGALGFKPGTFNSLQVVRILSTPEAFAEFRTLLGKLQQQMSSNLNFGVRPEEGLKTILAKLRSYHGLVNWESVIRNLKGESSSNSTTGGSGSHTTVINSQWEPADKHNWRYDSMTNRWIRIGSPGHGMGTGTITGSLINMTGTGNVLDMNGVNAASEWRLNTQTGQWERLAAVDGGGGHSGSDVLISNTVWSPGSNVNSWSKEQTTGGNSGSLSWSFGAGGSSSQSAVAAEASGGGANMNNMGMANNMGGAKTFQELLRQLQLQNNTSSMAGLDAASFASLLNQMQQQLQGQGKQTGQSGGQSVGQMSWQWSSSSSSGGGANNFNGTGSMGGAINIQDLLRQIQIQNGSASAPSLDTNMNSFMTFLNKMAQQQGQGQGQGQQGGQTGGQMSWKWSSASSTGGGASNMNNTDLMGGAMNFNDLFKQINLFNDSSSMSNMDGNRAAVMAFLTQIQQQLQGQGQGQGQKLSEGNKVTWQWSNKGGSATGTQLDTKRLDAILKQIQEAASAKGMSMNGGLNVGSNLVGASKRTIQEVIDTSQPMTNEITGGRIVGGTFSQFGQSGNGGSTDSVQSSGGATIRGSLSGFESSGGVKASGGASRGISSGEFKIGGMASGGMAAGGMASGGMTSGGKASGGMATSGMSSSGIASGGIASGGMISGGMASSRTETGGIASGGMASSGTASGGMASGGMASSGMASRGMASGGMASSGMASRGMASGGMASSGMASGGMASGGMASRGMASGSMVSSGMTSGGMASSGMATGGMASGLSGGLASQGGVSGLLGRADGANMITKTIVGESKPGVPDRSAPRGAQAKGVKVERAEGSIIGLNIPRQDFISGATVIGKGEEAVRVTKTRPQIRITDIVQEVNPASFDASMGGSASFSGSSGFDISGGGGMFSSSGSQGTGGASGSSQFVGRETVVSGKSGMAGGDYTQLGKVTGSGGGVKRIVDTHVKRIPGGAIKFDATGGVDLASLGLGGAEGGNIIRQTVQVDPSSGGQFIDANTLNSGAASGQLFGTISSSGGGSFGLKNKLNVGSLGTQQINQGFPLFITPDGMDTLLDGIAGKKRKKRSTRSTRSRRAANKQAYEALVTNCQGQDGQGPSIMVVANQGDVQFALKTYGTREPGIVSVPAVEGWNDVTLIYDGKTLTGVVENWKGFFKSSTNLSGNIERRQAGLLVGSCQGYKSFHGEIDDLTVYKCLTPDIMKLRDRVVA